MTNISYKLRKLRDKELDRESTYANVRTKGQRQAAEQKATTLIQRRDAGEHVPSGSILRAIFGG